MARSKPQLTHAKRDKERARLEKRARKQAKKDARKLAATDPVADPSLLDGDASHVHASDGAPDDTGVPSV
jgi:hypothetical protein